MKIVLNNIRSYSSNNIELRVVELSGFVAMLEALHLPFGGENKSQCHFTIDNDGNHIAYSSGVLMRDHDHDRIIKLIKGGDEHAKAVRALTAYIKITAPRYWWMEMDTYRIGTESLGSTSTMHIDCKGLSGEELVAAKEQMSEGTRMTQVRSFSYQTLARIYKQRHNHRLPHWREFCDFIATLPFAEFIVG